MSTSTAHEAAAGAAPAKTEGRRTKKEATAMKRQPSQASSIDSQMELGGSDRCDEPIGRQHVDESGPRRMWRSRRHSMPNGSSHDVCRQQQQQQQSSETPAGRRVSRRSSCGGHQPTDGTAHKAMDQRRLQSAIRTTFKVLKVLAAAFETADTLNDSGSSRRQRSSSLSVLQSDGRSRRRCRSSSQRRKRDDRASETGSPVVLSHTERQRPLSQATLHSRQVEAELLPGAASTGDDAAEANAPAPPRLDARNAAPKHQQTEQTAASPQRLQKEQTAHRTLHPRRRSVAFGAEDECITRYSMQHPPSVTAKRRSMCHANTTASGANGNGKQLQSPDSGLRSTPPSPSLGRRDFAACQSGPTKTNSARRLEAQSERHPRPSDNAALPTDDGDTDAFAGRLDGQNRRDASRESTNLDKINVGNKPSRRTHYGGTDESSTQTMDEWLEAELTKSKPKRRSRSVPVHRHAEPSPGILKSPEASKYSPVSIDEGVLPPFVSPTDSTPSRRRVTFQVGGGRNVEVHHKFSVRPLNGGADSTDDNNADDAYMAFLITATRDIVAASNRLAVYQHMHDQAHIDEGEHKSSSSFDESEGVSAKGSSSTAEQAWDRWLLRELEIRNTQRRRQEKGRTGIDGSPGLTSSCGSSGQTQTRPSLSTGLRNSRSKTDKPPHKFKPPGWNSATGKPQAITAPPSTAGRSTVPSPPLPPPPPLNSPLQRPSVKTPSRQRRLSLSSSVHEQGVNQLRTIAETSGAMAAYVSQYPYSPSPPNAYRPVIVSPGMKQRMSKEVSALNETNDDGGTATTSSETYLNEDPFHESFQSLLSISEPDRRNSGASKGSVQPKIFQSSSTTSSLFYPASENSSSLECSKHSSTSIDSYERGMCSGASDSNRTMKQEHDGGWKSRQPSQIRQRHPQHSSSSRRLSLLAKSPKRRNRHASIVIGAMPAN